MKKSEIKTGEVYSAKVSGSIVPVRIDRENPRGGWDGTNLKTKKSVRIKSGQRLRGKAATWPGKPQAKPAAPKKKATRAKQGGEKAKRPSGLAAAAQVLADAGTPLNAKDMVERMLAKGLWKTNGKTPAATIYAAIIREINAKGVDSRFEKVDRGQFQIRKGA